MNTTLSGKKVLYVEDDAFFADIMSTKLAEHGCTMALATTGDQAFTELEKSIPDLVVLDLMLPGGIDGFAVLEKMKANEAYKKIPVVILSNLDGLEDVEKGMQLGAFRYLTKSSVTPNEIVRDLEAALNALQLEA